MSNLSTNHKYSVGDLVKVVKLCLWTGNAPHEESSDPEDFKIYSDGHYYPQAKAMLGSITKITKLYVDGTYVVDMLGTPPELNKGWKLREQDLELEFKV